jgi:hypothetical protein
MDEQRAINIAIQALAGIPKDDDVPSANEQMWNELLSTYRKLKAAKPNDRSDQDRKFAICITEYEKLLSYFHTMILTDFEG